MPMSEPYFFLVKILDSLPTDIRDILLATAKEVTPFQRKENQRREKLVYDVIEKSGIRVHYLAPEEKKRFQAAAEHIIAKYQDVIGADILQATYEHLGISGHFKNNDTIMIGLDADLTLGSSRAGLAIKRGMELAVQEINEKGGLLGKTLKVLARDHGGISARGLQNLEFFSENQNLVAVMGGLHSPVALSEIDYIHRQKIIYLDPWAAATGIVENGHYPNYVFRISANDREAGKFLVEWAWPRYKKVALLLENTGWGRSNHQAIMSALAEKGTAAVAVEWFNWGEVDMIPQLLKIKKSGAEVLFLVANAPEGINVIRSMGNMSLKMPIYSHWGITGGNFWDEVYPDLDLIDLQFLQTFSFLADSNVKAINLGKSYCHTYHVNSVKEIPLPVGVAHAYDLVHLLAKAIQQAGSLDRASIRKALEEIDSYRGVVKNYEPPFSSVRHDALDKKDFFMGQYDKNGIVVPVENVYGK